MRILVTGAAGTLGAALLPRLVRAGHDVTALDLRGGGNAVKWVTGDVREDRVVAKAVAGIDVVIHTAALHGIHLREHGPREFFDLNVTGTFNVWQAAVAHRIRGVVFSSTMGVYGDSRKPLGEDDVVFVREDRPLLPGDIYGWTKVVGEELCRYHLREHGIPSVALRYGMFVPEPFLRYGIRLLYGGVHENDVAGAVLAAVEALELGTVGYEAVNVEAPLPFTPDDASNLRRNPMAALEQHFPGSTALLGERGIRTLKPITEVFPVTKLESVIGYRPRHDFAAWLDELRTRPEERSATDPVWP